MVLRSLFLAIFFLMLFCPVAKAGVHDTPVNLTVQEQKFIADNPVIRVANEKDWPPFDYYEFGRPKGLSIDYIKLLAKKVGLKIEFINGYTWSQLLALFKEKHIDVMPVLYKNSEREKYTLFIDPYYRGVLGVFINDISSIHGLSDLSGKKVGIQKGHGSISLINKQAQGIKLLQFNSTDDLVKKLATNKLDAIIGSPLLFYYFAKNNQITNIRPVDYIEMEKSERERVSMHVGVRKDWGLLYQILQKAARSISNEEMQSLEGRWAIGPFVNRKANLISLTDAEQAYINSHPVIKVSNELDYPPYDFVVGDQPHGYTIDLLKELADRTGLKLEFINGYSWAQLVELFINGKLDLLHTLTKTPDRVNLGLFSDPFKYFENHFIVRKDRPDITGINDLAGKIGAVGKGWGQEEFLSKYYPEVELLLFDNVEEMAEAVSTGKADFMISDIPVMKYLFVKRGINDLKFSGWVKELDKGKRRTFHFMAQNSDPELISILNKGLASLTPLDITKLDRKWLGSFEITPNRVYLDRKELAFINENPEVVLGSGISFDPFLIQNEDGTVDGYDSDIIKLISERTGLGIRVELGNWLDIQEKAKRRDLDGLSTSISHASRNKYFINTIPYIKLSSLIIVRKGNPRKIYSVKDLANKRVALQRGNIGFKEVINPYLDDIEIVYYDSIHDLIRAVVVGDADFTVLDETAYYIADQQGLGGFIESTFPVGQPLELRFQLRNDKPVLASIFAKGLKSISEQEKLNIRRRWFGSDKNRFSNKNDMVEFTSEEKGYLARKGGLSVCVYPDQMPYMSINSEGHLDGMAAEYNALFEERIGEVFRVVPTKTAAQTIEAIKRRQVDVLLMAEESFELEDYVKSTTPYLSFSYVIATNSDKLFIEDIGLEVDKKFSILKNSPAISKLRNMHPFIQLQEVDTLLDGIEMVREGAVLGYIDTSAAIGYAIQKELIVDIKIAGKIPLNLNLSVATPKDEPLLHSIFQKVVGSIGKEEKQRIYNQWVAVKYERGVDYSLVWKILTIAAIMLFASMYWNRKLSIARQKVQQTLEKLNIAQSQLQEKNEELELLAVTDRLTGLGNRMRLDSALQFEIARYDRHKHPLSVILMDIDYFKRINDKAGPPNG